MANVLIIGGGFGGLVAAEKLAASLGDEHRITLVSPDSKFTFYPALVRLALGDCEPDDITFDLVEKLDEIGVRYVQGEVIKVLANQKRVTITGKDFNGDISYDYLILAPGRRLATEKIPGFFDYANHILGTKAALEFGEEIRRFAKGNILVGMSPKSFLPVPVCETAFTLARKYEKEIEKNEVSVTVVFPESIDKAFGGANLHGDLLEAFEKHKIAVVTDFLIDKVNEKEVVTEEMRSLPFDLLMLLPPFRGHSFLSNFGISDENDFLLVDDLMRIPVFPGVYAVGDIVDFSGPKLAQMAVRQAEVAAANVLSEIKGDEPSEHYYHEIATIIDEGGADSIYLHYGIWDESLYRVKKGIIWSWAKKIHDKLWRAVHEP